MTLRTIDPGNDPAWAELMVGPRASLFGAPPWLGAIADTYGFDVLANVIVDDDRRARAGIAYAELDDFVGHRILSVPFCDYLDPIVDSEEQWKQLVDPLVAKGLPFQLRVLDSEIPRHDPRFVVIDEMAWHDTRLDRTEDELLGAMNRQLRQNIRAAATHGVTIRFGSDLGDIRAFHDLHRRTRKRKHQLLAQPVSFFENIWKQFAPSDSIVVGFAEHEGEVIAASFHVLWDGVWYFKFSASVFERSIVRPNELLAWESIRLAKQRGCSNFNWGVSDLEPPGLVAYKRKYGCDERRVAVLRHTPEGHENPKGAEAKSVLGELTGLLTREDVPDDVTQRAGEILYRYFT